MPRGVKRDYNDLIAQIDKEIAKYQAKIHDLKDKRAKLENEKRDSELSQLYKLMDEKSISPDELITLVKNRD